MNITATMPTVSRSNAKNLAPQKETVRTLALVACVKGSPVSVATARFYMARSGDGAKPVYCSFWLFCGTYNSGRGTARGYGYHKCSAALDAALDSAGIKLSQPIDSAGDDAMRDALIAVGVASGHKAANLAVFGG